MSSNARKLLAWGFFVLGVSLAAAAVALARDGPKFGAFGIDIGSSWLACAVFCSVGAVLSPVVAVAATKL